MLANQHHGVLVLKFGSCMAPSRHTERASDREANTTHHPCTCQCRRCQDVREYGRRAMKRQDLFAQ